ncbi:MAG TPA: acyl carrier protein [Chloroflexi bacterium]|nr:acyl carrier protein [Chloroflexota bacterium]
MEIEPKIRAYIAENLLFSDDGFTYSDEASFLQEGIVDSIGVMELVNFIEREFGLAVQDHELIPDNLDSVAQIAAYVRRKKAA